MSPRDTFLSLTAPVLFSILLSAICCIACVHVSSQVAAIWGTVLLQGIETCFALVKHESRSALPPNWVQSRPAPQDLVLPLRIGLAQQNVDRIEELLLDVSHPESPNYSNHWSASHIADTFRPSELSIATVREWLLSEGITSSRTRLSNSGGWMEANVSVAEAERLLKTQYHIYRHGPTDVQHVACAEGYHLPEHVTKHVDLVLPTLHFDVNPRLEKPKLEKRRMSINSARSTLKHLGRKASTGSQIKATNTSDPLADCDTQITPDCVRALYNYYYTPVAAEKNSIAIAEYTPQVYRPVDLDQFFQNYSTALVGKRPTLVSIDGGAIDINVTGFPYNVESNFDLSWTMALVTEKQPVTLYQVGDPVEWGAPDDTDLQSATFNNLLDALDGSYCTFEGGDDPSSGIDGIYPDPLPGGYKAQDCGTVKPAYVISSSYAYNEAELTPFYAARQCTEYAKLGLMGVTVLYSSGDGGVAGNDDLCLLANGTQSEDGTIFNPMFPGTCPFVTGVGGTQLDTGSKVTDPESALERDSFSSGGFSNYFALPNYQKDAVGSFLTHHRPTYPSTIWNATGSRGFPDLSANGASYISAAEGKWIPLSGTSASSPVVGAMLSSINDARLAVGKKPIGFINPVIYSAAFRDAFHDITNGSNPGCGTDGFSAVKGWDPVTGLGTPNFPKLLEKWLALP